MSSDRHVDFYLEPGLRQSAEAGQHNFIGKIVRVLEKSDFTVGFQGNSVEERDQAGHRPGYALFHMDEPAAANTLTFRRVYHYPFWQIENTTERWHWRVAEKRFNPNKIDAAEAERFFAFWQKRLFGQAAKSVSQDGFVYAPLQGRLTERRSFQTCSPLEMLVAVLQHEPSRRVIATLHPNESYTAGEMQKLQTLAKRFPRLKLQEGDMVDLLQRCDYVATQNSSVAFNGYFFRKPCILFARVDFHHIAGDVFSWGRERAFEIVQGEAPDFAKYIWWFWQEMSINAGREEAEKKIRQALRRGGFPI